ncbi:unnamed protein product [Musa acuminata subsp. burmannicoides]
MRRLRAPTPTIGLAVHRMMDAAINYVSGEEVVRRVRLRVCGAREGGGNCDTASTVVTTPTRSLTLNLDRKENNETHLKKLGKLNVCVNESLGSKTIMEIVFRCSELENKDLFSKSDPFLLMSRKEESGVLVPISKTEVKKNDRNPIWRPVIVNLQQIVSKENPLAIECFNFNSNGKHELIGKVIKSLAELEKLHHSQHGEDLFLPTLVGNDYEDKVLKSQIFVERFSQSKSKTFLDYISDGCEMNFMVAIDFTASNGNLAYRFLALH